MGFLIGFFRVIVMIRAVWSPKLVFFEKKESIKKINDQNYDVYERAFTFEAEDFHARTGILRNSYENLKKS